jgi:hypothetical protein
MTLATDALTIPGFGSMTMIAIIRSVAAPQLPVVLIRWQIVMVAPME